MLESGRIDDRWIFEIHIAVYGNTSGSPLSFNMCDVKDSVLIFGFTQRLASGNITELSRRRWSSRHQGQDDYQIDTIVLGN